MCNLRLSSKIAGSNKVYISQHVCVYQHLVHLNASHPIIILSFQDNVYKSIPNPKFLSKIYNYSYDDIGLVIPPTPSGEFSMFMFLCEFLKALSQIYVEFIGNSSIMQKEFWDI